MNRGSVTEKKIHQLGHRKAKGNYDMVATVFGVELGQGCVMLSTRDGQRQRNGAGDASRAGSCRAATVPTRTR